MQLGVQVIESGSHRFLVPINNFQSCWRGRRICWRGRGFNLWINAGNFSLLILITIIINNKNALRDQFSIARSPQKTFYIHPMFWITASIGVQSLPKENFHSDQLLTIINELPCLTQSRRSQSFTQSTWNIARKFTIGWRSPGEKRHLISIFINNSVKQFQIMYIIW